MGLLDDAQSRDSARIAETEYAFAVSYTHTLENRMLKKSDFDALLNASSFEAALRYLSDRGYGGSKAGQIPDAESMLNEDQRLTWSELQNVCPKGAPVTILLYQNDFHNLKAVLKAFFSGAAYMPLMLEPSTVDPETIHRAIAEGKPESLPNMMQKPGLESYRALARDGDGQVAEIILDKAYFIVLKEAAALEKSVFLDGWADLNITFMNMKVALRGVLGGKSRAFLEDCMLDNRGSPSEGGSTLQKVEPAVPGSAASRQINLVNLMDAVAKDLSAVLQVFTQCGYEQAAKAARVSPNAFDQHCDNELIRYVQSARHKAFGFEPIFGYWIGKQYEWQAVRIILSGLRGGVPPGALRGRLRDMYV
jgi:V/A-type H+-transporting ATPase subunit C